MSMTKRQIQTVKAREILDSRGNPTVEAVVILADGSAARAAAPSGASTGEYEAPELRDNDPARYLGKGVLQAIRQVNELIAPALLARDASCQQQIDEILCSLTDPKTGKKLGSNAMLSVSLACAKAAALSYHLPLYRYLGGALANTLPMPMMNILNGGVHAANSLDVQEFMVIPCGAQSFSQALEWCCRVYHRLKELLKEKGLSTSVGDEGGFAPNVPGEDEALSLIMQAFDRAGFVPGQDFVLGLDAASSEWVVPSEDGGEPRYTLPKAQRLAGLCADHPPVRLPGADCGGRPVCHQSQTHRRGCGDEGGQRGADKTQPDRHPLSDHRSGALSTAGGLPHHPVPPLRRDRGQHHRGHRGGLWRGADQDRRPLPRGADGEVQSASPD